MATIICVNCAVEMQTKTTGMTVESMTTAGPYKLHMGDRKECPVCGNQVVTGLGAAIAENKP